MPVYGLRFHAMDVPVKYFYHSTLALNSLVFVKDGEQEVPATVVFACCQKHSPHTNDPDNILNLNKEAQSQEVIYSVIADSATNNTLNLSPVVQLDRKANLETDTETERVESSIESSEASNFVADSDNSAVVKTASQDNQKTKLEEADINTGNLPEIVREATEAEYARKQANDFLASEATAFCKKCIRKRQLDMKLVQVEVFFDRSKYIFYFIAPTRIDFRELVRDLVQQYHVRIELRQIGVRHGAQMVGALGGCGRVCCCHSHLQHFAPVTIRMAKEQHLFLNPAKISGICGRLLCCLAYEQDNYDQFHCKCPRIGKRYQTKRGIFKILRANMLRNSISVLTLDNEELEITLEEWETLESQRINYQGSERDGFDDDDIDDLMDLRDLEDNN